MASWVPVKFFNPIAPKMAESWSKNVCPKTYSQISIFLNETNFIWYVPVRCTYCLWFIAWFMLRCLIYSQKPLKMENSWPYFSSFFVRNFQNQCKTKFLPYSTIDIFDFGIAKILTAKFWIFPGKFQNLAIKFFRKFYLGLKYGLAIWAYSLLLWAQ